MKRTFSFRFLDDRLNQELVMLIKKSGVRHAIDPRGVIHYSSEDEELVGNDLIPRIRNRVFSSWQVLFCPGQCSDSYKQYMIQHDIPFVEELIDKQLSFLIPRKYRPHSWKLDLQRCGDPVRIAR